jgi:putative exosortase-associated protein (TIGR04073 family)
MKSQSRVLALSLILTLSFSFPVLAADNGWNKLGRGFTNIISSPLEIFNQPIQMSKTERWPIACFGGFFKGIVMMVERIGVGVYEIVTFPIPWPNGYEPLILPEFIIPVDSDTAPLEPVKV